MVESGGVNIWDPMEGITDLADGPRRWELFRRHLRGKLWYWAFKTGCVDLSRCNEDLKALHDLYLDSQLDCIYNDVDDSLTWLHPNDLGMHRLRGPALMCYDVTGRRFSMSWYRYDELHREGGLPAVEDDEWCIWALHGKYHREGGLPAVVSPYVREWHVNGEYHREGGLPAIENADGSRTYIEHDLIHRARGRPAIVCPDPVLLERWEHGVRSSPIPDEPELEVEVVWSFE